MREPEPPPVVAVPAADDPAAPVIADMGAARNTFLQLAGQVVSLIATAGLTLYLVRALGAAGYGIYALAISAAALMMFPAQFGLPLAVGRFLADHRTDAHQLREIFRLGLRLQLAAATAAAAILFAVAGPAARAYGHPHLLWPVRWAALSLIGLALFGFLTNVGLSVRRASVVLWMTIIESVAEAAAAVSLVVAGAGVAGATLGKLVGYSLAAGAGIYLTVRLLRGHVPARHRRPRAGRRNGAPPRVVSLRELMRYASAQFVVESTWSAIIQLDVMMIGALLTATAVGSFSSVVKLLGVLGYLGTAVSGGVAPRLSLAAGSPDVRSFQGALRYLAILQGLTIAPLVVWARPVVGLALGSGYGQSPSILRALVAYSFLSAWAPLVTMTVTYLGEARRRVPILLATLGLGVAATYGLIRLVGVIGAAIADDVVLLVYVGAHLWLCARLITLDLRPLALSLARTLSAAAAMALLLYAVGTGSLSAAQWIGGLGAGAAVYAAVLLITREISIPEIRAASAAIRGAALRR